MPRLRVLVLMGGPSTEHDVSVVSGTGVVRAMDPDAQSVAMEAHGVHNGTTALLTSTYFPAAVPMLALSNVWITVGLGAAYAVGATVIGWMLLHKRVLPLLDKRK